MRRVPVRGRLSSRGLVMPLARRLPMHVWSQRLRCLHLFHVLHIGSIYTDTIIVIRTHAHYILLALRLRLIVNHSEVRVSVSLSSCISALRANVAVNDLDSMPDV